MQPDAKAQERTKIYFNITDDINFNLDTVDYEVIIYGMDLRTSPHVRGRCLTLYRRSRAESREQGLHSRWLANLLDDWKFKLSRGGSKWQRNTMRIRGVHKV